MSSINAIVARLLLVASFVALAGFAPARASDPSVPTAFVGVHVVPMDADRVLENQTVVVRDGRIAAIGPVGTVDVPADAIVVEGHGRYLVPGLADMHTHLYGLAEPYSGEDQLIHYLAAGVTTIRSLSGKPATLALRDRVDRGELLGPTIYTSGRTMVGLPDFLVMERYKLAGLVAAFCTLLAVLAWIVAGVAVRRRSGLDRWRRIVRWRLPSIAAALALGAVLVLAKVVPLDPYMSRAFLDWAHFMDHPEEARASVRAQKAAGYDAIKVYDYLPPAATIAALDEARKRGIYAVGHLNDEQSLEEQLDAGLREIAHVDELIHVIATGESSPESFNAVEFDYARIPEAARTIAAHDVYVVSNLVADEVAYRMLEDTDGWLARPEYAEVSADVIRSWKTEGRAVSWQGQEAWRRDTLQPALLAMLRALHDAGATLLVGTDVSVEGMMPDHLHRDLELLVEAGLTPYEALAAGTRNAGMSVARMGRDGSFGAVQVGYRADLLLLEENPLADISATRRRAGVMTRGRWIPQAQLGPVVAERIR